MIRASIFALLCVVLTGAAATADELPRVRVATSMGAFVLELEPKRAPLTVENFLGYVHAGHYTGTLFHRAVANFVIQGGGVDREHRMKAPQPPVPNESGNGLRNVRGTVGLARTERPHSGDVQFYINVADNPDLDPLPSRWGYAVFGRVVEGMEVVDRISLVPTGAAGPFRQDVPLTPVVIESIEVVAAPAVPPAAPAAPAPPPPAQQPAS